MAKEIYGIELNNGALIVKYGDDYAYCYDSAYYCRDQILTDIATFQAEGDISYWDGNDPSLLGLFEECTAKEILDVEDIYDLFRSFDEAKYDE